MILTAVVWLSIVHADVAVITNLIVLLGLGGGLGVLSGIKTNVNGNLRTFAELIATSMNRLAESQPSTHPPDVSPFDKGE